MGKNKHGHRRDANFTEEVVGYALETFLTLFSFPHHRFSIEPFSRARERWLGADARLHGDIQGFRPFYMQFKRPAAYPDFSSSALIKDRKRLGLPVTPQILYFPLRDKQKSHTQFQHNVLLKLRSRLQRRGLGDAAYVCPLFLDRAAYRFHVHMAGFSAWLKFWRHMPWELGEVLLSHGNGTVRFGRIPVFAEHVTIPPHTAVTDARHRYSFTEQGTDLCFHSPEALPEGASRLSDFLKGVSDGFLGRGQKIEPRNADEELFSLMAAVYGEEASAPFEKAEMATGDPIGNWLAWGDHLREQYEIEQYALVRWID